MPSCSANYSGRCWLTCRSDKASILFWQWRQKSVHTTSLLSICLINLACLRQRSLVCFVKKLVKKTDTLSPFHTSVFASLHSLHQNKTKDISSSKYLCFNVSCTFSWGALGDSLPSSLTLSWKLQQQAALRYLVIMGASFGSWPVEAWVSWGPRWLGSDLLWSRMGTHWVLGDTCAFFLKDLAFCSDCWAGIVVERVVLHSGQVQGGSVSSGGRRMSDPTVFLLMIMFYQSLY